MKVYVVQHINVYLTPPGVRVFASYEGALNHCLAIVSEEREEFKVPGDISDRDAFSMWPMLTNCSSLIYITKTDLTISEVAT